MEIWRSLEEHFLARAFGISEVAYERLPVWRQPEDDLPWTSGCGLVVSENQEQNEESLEAFPLFGAPPLLLYGTNARNQQS